jgi:hypothetical protein
MFLNTYVYCNISKPVITRKRKRNLTSAGALYSAACQVPYGSVRVGKLLFAKPSSATVNDGPRAITKNDESAKNKLLIVDFRGGETNILLVSCYSVKGKTRLLLRMSKDARRCFLYT